MAINLDLPKKLITAAKPIHSTSVNIFRPISRKYDKAEHKYPIELDSVNALHNGVENLVNVSSGASGSRNSAPDQGPATNRNGSNISSVLSAIEASYGDVGLLLTLPYQGLGNAAITSVATDEQLAKFGKKIWASMAITEADFGSDSAAVSMTAKLVGDEWVLNGEKIFVTAGSRSTHIVVWATLDKSLGRAAIKSFVVPRDTPGVTIARLEEKLGIKASDTAQINFTNARIPKDHILGNPEINTKAGFGGVMATFDNTRPIVAGMAIGVSRAALEELRTILEKSGIEISYDKPKYNQSAAAAEFLSLEADYEASLLLSYRAAWMADNKQPNSLQASMSKAKAGRTGTAITLKAVELAGQEGYSERLLLEKWSRDSKILDIFEGTQQIQQLIVARRLLGLSSSQLK